MEDVDQTRKSLRPQFPFLRFPIWPGNGEGIPDSRLGRNREQVEEPEGYLYRDLVGIGKSPVSRFGRDRESRSRDRESGSRGRHDGDFLV
jgi:hypothetical protein